MKFTSFIIGIAFIMLLSIIPIKLKSQTFSGISDRSKCYFCADSVEYVGLVRLYTDYHAQLEINYDLDLRLEMLDNTYLETRKSLNEALNRLDATNNSMDSLMQQNKIYFEKTTDLKNKLKGWRIYGVTISVSLVSAVTILLLTK